MHGAIRSTWLMPLAALVLLAPNGMNRPVTPGASADPLVLIARAALRVTALPFGTHVAAKCVAANGHVTLIDADGRCEPGATRSEVFVRPDENILAGMAPEDRAKALRPAQAASSEAASQCVALDDLLRVIDDEARRPLPWARKDELLEMRGRASIERDRLLC